MGKWLGGALGSLLGKVVIVLVPGLLVGLLGGLGRTLLSPVTTAAAATSRRWRSRRDRSAVKKDWKALRKGRIGRLGKDLGKRTRRRAAKRTAAMRR